MLVSWLFRREFTREYRAAGADHIVNLIRPIFAKCPTSQDRGRRGEAADGITPGGHWKFESWGGIYTPLVMIERSPKASLAESFIFFFRLEMRTGFWFLGGKWHLWKKKNTNRVLIDERVRAKAGLWASGIPDSNPLLAFVYLMKLGEVAVLGPLSAWLKTFLGSCFPSRMYGHFKEIF